MPSASALKTQIRNGFPSCHMVMIRFAEISGLYSYNSEKNRIDFGKKTLIVGPNNTGKSSIFKALKLFLDALEEFSETEQKPWDLQGIHEMTVGLTLDDAERRYVAETLLITSPNTTGPFALAPNSTVMWLARKLGDVTLTMRWNDSPLSLISQQIEYFLHMEDLGVSIYSRGYNGDVWATERPKPNFQYKSNSKSLSEALDAMMKNDLTKKEHSALFQQGIKISAFPDVVRLMDTALQGMSTSDDNTRIRFVRRLSGNKTPRRTTCSFFIMLGHMLGQKISFISEQRSFLESNDLEKLPLRDGGGNLQSFLFWLKNGDEDGQAAYSAIQNKFKDVLGRQHLSFNISIIEKREPQDEHVIEPVKERIYPGRITVLFAETRGKRQKSINFASVGAGVREILFLLTKCLGQQGGIILMDEPATNLHPEQIRRLMGEILTPGGSNGKSNQVVLITHSPPMASLELLSSVNEIVRVDKEEYSRIVQPSREDKVWMAENLATFHSLKSDVLFTRKVVLVEGSSDKIFLEAILRHSTGPDAPGDDIIVLDVGGYKSFKKFREFLEIFEIPFVILADGDAKNQFATDEVLVINPEFISSEYSGSDKIVCLLENKLEDCLAHLEPDLYNRITAEYDTKPERAYHFIRRLVKDSPGGAWSNLSGYLTEWIVKSCNDIARQKAARAGTEQ